MPAKTIYPSPFFVRNIVDIYLRETNTTDHIFTLNELSTMSSNKPELKQKIVDTIQKNCGLNITMGYAKDLVKSLLASPADYDMIIISPTRQFEPEHTLGFLIVEKNECKKMNGVWSVNLICSNANRGKLLLGLYLYTIIANPHIRKKKGILELANGYVNSGGLCMYSKYGFAYDETMYGKNCFPDHGNLPMQIDLSKMKLEDVLQIVNGIVSSIPADVKSFCAMRGNAQLSLALCKNLLRYLELGVDDEYAIELDSSNKAVFRYESLLNDIQPDPIPTLKQIITDIESNNFDVDIFVETYYDEPLLPSIIKTTKHQPKSVVASTKEITSSSSSSVAKKNSRPVSVSRKTDTKKRSRTAKSVVSPKSATAKTRRRKI